MYSPKIQTVLDILKDEATGNTAGALSKTHPEYTMTWVYNSYRGELFPRTTMTETDGKDTLQEVYRIQGRKYEILTIAENDNTVMIEMIESYPDPETQEVYRTPLVLVLTFEDGKIKTGRHYCDPNISFMHLTEDQVDTAYADKKVIMTIMDTFDRTSILKIIKQLLDDFKRDEKNAQVISGALFQMTENGIKGLDQDIRSFLMDASLVIGENQYGSSPTMSLGELEDQFKKLEQK